jgi:hypothetical protein
MIVRLASKAEQPEGGYMHPNHLLGYGPPHQAWSLAKGWYETNKYCIAPSASIWRSDYVKGRK